MNESTLHSQNPGTEVGSKSPLGIVYYVAGALVLYPFALAIYNLYWSPLAKFPGPKLAAATGWYEAFYDIWNNNFHDVIDRMHEKYGPIVRINPWEIHIKDPGFYDKVFVTAAAHRSDIRYIPRAGRVADQSFPMTTDHDLHHRRRRVLEPFFSRLGISRVESVIHDEMRRLDERICSLKGSGSVVRLEHAYEAWAADILATIACGDRPGLSDTPESSLGWHNLIDSTVRLLPILRNMGDLSRYKYPEASRPELMVDSVVAVIPVGFLKKVYPEFAGFKMITMLNEDRVSKVKAEVANETKATEDDVRQSIFHSIARSDIPESEKSTERLMADALAILLAASITNSHVMTLTTYYILANPDIEKRLREELHDVMAGYPDKPPSWVELEKLPYLNACIKEGLRINHVTRRNTRMAPDVELQYKGWTIPKNTPVSMSLRYLQMDPEVFPEPKKFKPERWLGQHDIRMHKNMLPFQKGSRDCIGKNLAYAELYILIGTLFRPGSPSLTLVNCDESDIVPVRESEIGIPKKGSRGLNVLVN